MNVTVQNSWKRGRETLKKIGRIPVSDHCTCPICKIVKDKKSHSKLYLEEYISEDESLPKSNQNQATKLCSECFQEVGQGLR